MKDIESRVAAIELRNKNVEQDKAWETSIVRRVSIAMLTYVVVVLYLTVINNNSPFVNGLVPAVGFLLSTLALGWIRKIWEKTID